MSWILTINLSLNSHPDLPSEVILNPENYELALTEYSIKFPGGAGKREFSVVADGVQNQYVVDSWVPAIAVILPRRAGVENELIGYPIYVSFDCATLERGLYCKLSPSVSEGYMVLHLRKKK